MHRSDVRCFLLLQEHEPPQCLLVQQRQSKGGILSTNLLYLAEGAPVNHEVSDPALVIFIAKILGSKRVMAGWGHAEGTHMSRSERRFGGWGHK